MKKGRLKLPVVFQARRDFYRRRQDEEARGAKAVRAAEVTIAARSAGGGDASANAAEVVADIVLEENETRLYELAQLKAKLDGLERAAESFDDGPVAVAIKAKADELRKVVEEKSLELLPLGERLMAEALRDANDGA